MENNYFIQFYYDSSSGFNETESVKIPIKLTNEAQEFIFKLPKNIKIKDLRIDPVNCKTVASITDISLSSGKNRLDLMDQISSYCFFIEPNLFIYNIADPYIIFNNIHKIDLNRYDYLKIIIRYHQFDSGVLMELAGKATGSGLNSAVDYVKKPRFKSPRSSLNILYFSPFASHQVNKGGSNTRIYQFASRLKSLGHNVHFVTHSRAKEYLLGDLSAMKNTWTTLDEIPDFRMPPDLNGDIPFDAWYQEGLGEEIGGLCYKYDIDIVLCSYICSSKLLEFVPNHILKIIDTHDKFGNRFDMLRSNNIPNEFFSCTPEDKGRYLRRADIVIAMRAEEADYFNDVSGLQTAIVVSHFEEPKFINRRFDRLYSVGIVMGSSYVNLQMLTIFILTLYAPLQGKTSPFVIYIVRNIKSMIESLPEDLGKIFNVPYIRLCGFLPDIGSFYREMDLIATPVTIGTGINVKSVEAMVYGMPMITTMFGSKGIETTEPMHLYENIDGLVESLFDISARPEELNRLAASSRFAYRKFYDKNLRNFNLLFEHPKLRDNLAANSIR